MRVGNPSLLLQLVALVVGVPTAIVAIAIAAGTHWLEAMICTAVVMVVAFVILTAISLLRS